MAIGQIDVKDEEPPRIVTFDLQAIPPGVSAAEIAVKLDATVRARVLDRIAAKLTELYVYADTAKKMVESLRAHQQKGEYDAIQNGYVFATRLT